MTHALQELVHLVGEDASLVARVKQAVEWIASKPEGLAILEEARALHGKPLVIRVDANAEEVGYGDQGEHVITANPLLSESIVFHGKNGESILNSLERFFCHEFKHAVQPGILGFEQEYTSRRARIMEEHFTPPPMEEYSYRMRAAVNDSEVLRALAAEIYDEHIAPQLKGVMDALAADPIIQGVVDKYETGAMEFENFMMEKYKNEPHRMMDYLRSEVISREGFVESIVASIQENIGAQSESADRGC